MPRKVRTAAKAVAALDQARLWLLQPGSGSFGLQRWTALQSVPRRLRDHPFAGPVCPENSAYRQIVVHGYIFYYRIMPGAGGSATAGDIEIVDIFGPGQDRVAPGQNQNAP